jgi:hypothetical protein
VTQSAGPNLGHPVYPAGDVLPIAAMAGGMRSAFPPYAGYLMFLGGLAHEKPEIENDQSRRTNEIKNAR